MLILVPMVLEKDETFNHYLTCVVQPKRLTWQRPSKLCRGSSKKTWFGSDLLGFKEFGQSVVANLPCKKYLDESLICFWPLLCSLS